MNQDESSLTAQDLFLPHDLLIEFAGLYGGICDLTGAGDTERLFLLVMACCLLFLGMLYSSVLGFVEGN